MTCFFACFFCVFLLRFNFLLSNDADLLQGDPLFHAWAGIGHGLPVFRVADQGSNIGPGSAHAGFNRVDGALSVRVKKNTPAICASGKDKFCTGGVAVFLFKRDRVCLEEFTDPPHIRLSDIGAAKPLTAVTAESACEDIIFRQGFRSHIASPGLFAW